MGIATADQGTRMRTRVLGSAVVVAFLVLTTGLGIRSLVTNDTRFGWGMFSHQVDYTISYAWVADDGTLLPLEVADLPRRHWYLEDDGARSTRYGEGALRGWIIAFMRHVDAQERPEGATGMQAEVSYRVNGGPSKTMVLTAP